MLYVRDRFQENIVNVSLNIEQIYNSILIKGTKYYIDLKQITNTLLMNSKKYVTD